MFLPFPICKPSSVFDLTSSKSLYPHSFNTKENLNYVGPIPDDSYYGADKMSDVQRTDFLEWNESQMSVTFDNRRVLESYFQDDVIVLRQACQLFRREFLTVGNIEASSCNKMLRKLFLKPDTIGLIPTDGYCSNVNYSKKALMWFVYREQADGRRIMHGRNGREYRLPELPRQSVDGFCEETKTVYAFFEYHWNGHTFLPFRDISTVAGDTLAERYERTMTRLEQITQAGHQVEVLWESEFDEGILANHPELRTHPIVQHGPLKTRDSLYAGRTEAMRFHYKIREGETI